MSIGGATLPEPPNHEAGKDHESHQRTDLQVRLKVTRRKALGRRAPVEPAYSLGNCHANHAAREVSDDRERKRHQITPPARRRLAPALRVGHAQYAASRRATDTTSVTCGST